MLFSGGATLVVLLLLGLAIYTAVSNSLMDQGVAQLQERAQPIVQWVKSGGAGPAPVDARFGGRTTGTLAMLLDSDDEIVRQDFRGDLPDGLPSIDGANGARAAGKDIRTMSSGNYPAPGPERLGQDTRR